MSKRKGGFTLPGEAGYEQTKSPMQDMESILLSVLLEITMHGQRRIRISYSRHF